MDSIVIFRLVLNFILCHIKWWVTQWYGMGRLEFVLKRQFLLFSVIISFGISKNLVFHHLNGIWISAKRNYNIICQA